MSKTPLTDDFAEHDFVMEAIRLHPMILERIKAWADFARKLETDRAELVEALGDCVEALSHAEERLYVRINPPTLTNARALLARLEADK